MDKNKIAVVICNYNGGMDTIKCIDTVLKSQNVCLDIYVVDNASTDGSPDRIREQFGAQVDIIQNSENLGGSGGFARGLQTALEKEYPYIMMLDNDAYVDYDTIEKLQAYLQSNPDVGIVGAKILMEEEPERIMDYAKVIHFETFIDQSAWYGKMDSEEANMPRECDFAAATAAMLPGEVLKKCGNMDEKYFIYYDDIELGYRIKKHGYRVVSLGSAKAWHKSGMRRRTTNTFTRYYLARNRYHFFAKYMSDEQIEPFIDHILLRAFSYMYGSYYKKRMDIFYTEKYILEDFIYGRRGKAGNHRINDLQKDGDRFMEQELSGCKCILIHSFSNMPETHFIKWYRKLEEWNPNAKIVINALASTPKECTLYLERLKEHFPENSLCIERVESADKKKYDKIIHFCRHVKEATKNILPEVSVDMYGNMIVKEEDYIYFRNYEKSYEFFKAIYREPILEAIHRIRTEEV